MNNKYGYQLIFFAEAMLSLISSLPSLYLYTVLWEGLLFWTAAFWKIWGSDPGWLPPSAMPEPTSSTCNALCTHSNPPIYLSDDTHAAVGCPIRSIPTYHRQSQHMPIKFLWFCPSYSLITRSGLKELSTPHRTFPACRRDVRIISLSLSKYADN